MNDQENGPEPQGSEEASSAELGGPEQEAAEVREAALAERAEERPDLDERERDISAERKPMGPPLEEGEEGEAARLAEEDAPPAPGEPPTELGEP